MAADPDKLYTPLESTPPVVLAHMRRRHVREVLKIEESAFPRPWSMTLFLSELALRGSRSYVVALAEQEEVVGYFGLMYIADEAHITTIAVDPRWHRHRIGTRMMLEIFRIARERDVQHLTLEVRVSNQAGQALYRKFGFAPAGIRRAYYVDNNEDAIVMWAEDIHTMEMIARTEHIAADVRKTNTSKEWHS